jgi:putative pyruvate formate lyase activating enzyme
MSRAHYVELCRSGQLGERIEKAVRQLASCRLCPRKCGVNRLDGERGECRTGRLARIASFGPHFGEEAPLVGSQGSGTTFFCGCNLGCVFCQNADISQGRGGREVDAKELADIFIKIQNMGCANLNLVTPTHVLAQILEALEIAIHNGLALPLVWNCGGYESVEALSLLDGVVHIYLPDLKFMDEKPARDTCNAPDYPERATAAIKEMHRQVGDLVLDETGLAVRGLLVRHLIMPGGLAGSDKAIAFLADDISKNTYVNIMNQYRPCHLAHGDPQIGYSPERKHWLDARATAIKAGLRLDI